MSGAPSTEAGTAAPPPGPFGWLGAALTCSGAAALVFEALWFRQAGLALGNSVWASSIVLASFMAGLALGNGLVARRAGRLARPVRAYGALEVAIGLSGLALVLLLPSLNAALSPLLRPFLDRTLLLNTVRVCVAFLLLGVPATAMGATLPLAVRALSSSDPNFGRVLGRLYGLNTLGGVAGVLAAEFVLVPALGVRLSGVAAALLNVAAAACALRFGGGRPVAAAPPVPALPSAADPARRLLVAAFLAGGALLALEVVWFRLLLLFMLGSSAQFAMMLAAVLSGIALGSLAASVWMSRRPEAPAPAAAALLAGCVTVLAYLWYSGIVGAGRRDDAASAGLLALALMLPTSVMSGVLFTLIGRAVQSGVGDASRATARLTLANTLGAMSGAFLGGFVLVPTLGAEASLFVLACVYGLVALLGWPRAGEGGRTAAAVRLAAGAALGLLLAFFPFGRMHGRLLALVRQGTEPGLQVEVVREGRTETVQYARKDFFGQPLHHRLITNGYSMSGSNFTAQRYMGLYVYWPLALRPRSERALLISYGVGVTARALVETRSLRSIDVVDISREILGLSSVPFGADGDPLRDPRVRVHVEDGRFFLQTTDRTFDLITGEPPPPKAAGIGSLYSLEYFSLMRERLAPGGLATYWLPVQELEPREARAIVKAFCTAFEDCTLWTGAAAEWMLAGSRPGGTDPTAEEFTRQWADPVTAGRLRDVAIERPWDLGGLFLGDAAWLAEYTRGVPPLTDDRPGRLSPHRPPTLHPDFVATMDVAEAQARFERSAWVAAHWPAPFRERAADGFAAQALVNRFLLTAYGVARPLPFPEIAEALSRPGLRAAPLAAFGVSSDVERAAVRAHAAGVRGDALEYVLAVRALGERDHAGAAAGFRALASARPQDGIAVRCLILALLLQGDRAGAAPVAAALRARSDPSQDPGYWAWLDAQLAAPADAPPPR